jgi:Glycosyl hydrolases family 18.
MNVYDNFQLCALISEGGWTIERDEDLTAPYAFKNDTWLSFDDSISVGIKVSINNFYLILICNK